MSMTKDEFREFCNTYGIGVVRFALLKEGKDVEYEDLDLEHEIPVLLKLASLLNALSLHGDSKVPLSMKLMSLTLSTGQDDDPLLQICLSSRDEEFVSGKDLDAELHNAALRAYPYLLISEHLSAHRESAPFGFGQMLLNWEDQQRLARLLASDSALSALFPGFDGDVLRISSMVALSNGTAGTVQASMLPSQLLTTAYQWMRVNSEESLESFQNHVNAVLHELRRGATKGKVKTPVLLAYRGLDIQRLGPQKLGEIRLYPWSEVYSGLVLSDARPSQDSEGNRYGMVAVVDLELKVKVSEWNPDPNARFDLPWSEAEMAKATEVVDRAGQDLCLSAFLALDGQRVGVQESYRQSLSPFGFSGSGWARDHSPTTPTVVDERAFDQLQHWHERVTTVRSPKSEVGLRRIRSALVDRRDPIDAIIDAIVSWENLFGSTSGELRFRISTAMALLIETDHDARSKLQKEIRELYDARSRIVHGGSPPKPQEAAAKLDRVFEITRSMLRAVYEHHPSTMEHKKSSQDLIVELASEAGT